MLKRLLIANRGEIARRIIRTARRMGVETVAVYSDADVAAPHVREADAAVRIGPATARESYLDMDRVLAAARDSGADSVHPGYGFLSENAQFAEAVEAAGLVWVGPPASAIRAMGLKDAAKALMAQAGVPVTPGYMGDDQSPARLKAEAERTGFPVLIKAVAGGGGKGMRRVDAADAFDAALTSCRREAAASFGDDRVLIERYMRNPRHIEVQVFADAHGAVVHLFERDCSLQRRHQKVIEEAPAPGMDEATRAAVCGAAITAARAVNYRGAGTVEFIADASEGLRADRIFFMEMNTRLQVEHPVTEMVTGLDLVEWQLRVAAGERLPLRQDHIRLHGCAMEARLYAEDPATGFLPSTGRLEVLRLPTPSAGALRVDSGVAPGGEVTPFYDPMIAKVIAHADTREAAAQALSQAMAATAVWPVRTNAGFLSRLAAAPDFVAGRVDTGFIAARQDALVDKPPAPDAVLSAFASDRVRPAAAAHAALDAPALTGLRLNAPPADTLSLWVDGAPRTARLRPAAALAPPGPAARADVLFHGGEAYAVSGFPPSAAGGESAGDGRLASPMPGRIVQLAATAGAKVAKGEVLVTLEAMKMEHGLAAPFDAVVAEVNAAVGDQVVEGALLVRLERAEPAAG